MSETLKVPPQLLHFPFTVFKTQRRMNDDSADDMKYGDLTETQLKEKYGLSVVSGKVDPYTGESINLPISNYAVMRQKISHSEVTKTLFNEFRSSSTLLSFWGYRDLFLKLINHLQVGKGTPFSHPLLDMAYKQQIINDRSEENSSLLKIKETIKNSINWDNGVFLNR